MCTDKEIQNFFCNVKKLRLENKLTKKRMAQICGIGVGSLNKIEQGIMPARLSAEILCRLHYYFGVSPDELFKEMSCTSEN